MEYAFLKQVSEGVERAGAAVRVERSPATELDELLVEEWPVSFVN